MRRTNYLFNEIYVDEINFNDSYAKRVIYIFFVL